MAKYYTDHKLKGKHKHFNKKLYDKYDITARKIIKEKLGDYVIDNSDPYKQDFILPNNKKYKYLEIQVCSTWEKSQFPYSRIFIYERKSLYGADTLYLTLNKLMTKGYLFDRNSINNVKPRRLKKWSREFVYDIPWGRVLLLFISDLSKKDIEMY